MEVVTVHSINRDQKRLIRTFCGKPPAALFQITSSLNPGGTSRISCKICPNPWVIEAEDSPG